MTATPALEPVFDGHNDVLLRLYNYKGADPVRVFFEGKERGQLDMPKAVSGGFAGGMFAIFVPSPAGGTNMDTVNAAMASGQYAVPLPPLLPVSDAQAATFAMAALLFRLEAASEGALKVCRSVSDIRAARATNAIAAVLHIEGAEAIDTNFDALEVLQKAGLRSLGPVWSRSNVFADGVPFRFPSSADIGNGLTDAGKALVRACNDLKILIDLSHMNEKGFWDIAELSEAPLVATHSNAHALCASSRNLTDKQLDAIKRSNGLVGVNFATSFLRQDGRRIADTPLDSIVDHIAYLIDRMGEDCVALGSDFDGAQMPAELGTAAGLPNLVAAMRRRQFGNALITKVCFENWMRVLSRTWGQ